MEHRGSCLCFCFGDCLWPLTLYLVKTWSMPITSIWVLDGGAVDLQAVLLRVGRSCAATAGFLVTNVRFPLWPARPRASAVARSNVERLIHFTAP